MYLKLWLIDANNIEVTQLLEKKMNLARVGPSPVSLPPFPSSGGLVITRQF